MLPTLIVFAVIAAILVTWYRRLDITEYEYICANCGAKRKTFESPQRNSARCSSCAHSQLIPTETPRGRELNELYHGSTAAEQRLRTTQEAASAIVARLEGAVPATAVADELRKLAHLAEVGALSPDEWQRAKGLILGHPRDKQADAIDRVARLYRAHKAGALSESEFNMTKWDILSRVGRSPS